MTLGNDEIERLKADCARHERNSDLQMERAIRAEAEIERLREEVEKLRERCEAYKGQVWAGSQEIERLRAVLKECADDLGALVEASYSSIGRHPAMQRRYDRDIAPVLRAQEILNEQVTREYDCETCRDDPEECAKVPGLRYCEKTQRGE